MSDTPPLSNGQVAWRLGKVEAKVDQLEAEMDRRFDALAAQIKAQGDESNERISRIYYAFIGLLVTIAASAVVFALTVNVLRQAAG